MMREVVLALLTPPFSLMMLAAWISLALARGRGRFGLAAFWISVAVLCTPVVADALLRLPLLAQPRLDPSARPAAPFAVVVPTGGVTPLAGGLLWPSDDTVLRVQQGVVLAREMGSLLVISGGTPGDLPESEARVTARALGLTGEGILLEEDSDNTCENAERSAALLQPLGITRVIAVTDTRHMARFMACLRHHGLTPMAAMAAHEPDQDGLVWLDYLPGEPGARALGGVFHAHVGLVWYILTGRLDMKDLWPRAP